MNQTAPAIHALNFLRTDTWSIDSAHLAARQRAFDFVVTALRKQGAAGAALETDPETSDEVFNCVYFDAATGNRCGIGHMIAPVYSPRLEGLNWDGIAGRYPTSVDYVIACDAAVKHIDETFGLDSAGRDMYFLSYLQSQHDDADRAARFGKDVTFADAFERRVVEFAATWALTMPAKDN